jgi:hypothetical protein
MAPTTDRITPIPLEEVTEGYYWAQFIGPLEIVQVLKGPNWSPISMRVLRHGDHRTRFLSEFRFWQKIEVPNVSL